MEAENLFLNYPRQWQVIKKFCEAFPNIRVAVLSQTLIVKAINLSDLPRLMIPSKNRYAIWVPDFQGYKECHSLN